MIRVFARKTKWSPTDELAFFGSPPMYDIPDLPVMVSVTFTWDLERGWQLWQDWQDRFKKSNCRVRLGGPAFNYSGGQFTPGQFIKKGVTITSRGCPKNCPWCLVPLREGPIRELTIKPGHIVQDNNLLACSHQHIEEVFEMLSEQRKSIEFSGGLDIDYLKSTHVELLKKIKIGQLFVSCDCEKDLSRLDKAVDLLADFPINKKRCYVLVGFGDETQEQAQARCETVLAKGFLPFAQLYRDVNSKQTRGGWREFCWFWSQPKLYRKKYE